MLPPLNRIDRMKYTELLDIAAKINEVAKSDGVCAEVNFNPELFRGKPSQIKICYARLITKGKNKWQH